MCQNWAQRLWVFSGTATMSHPRRAQPRPRQPAYAGHTRGYAGVRSCHTFTHDPARAARSVHVLGSFLFTMGDHKRTQFAHVSCVFPRDRPLLINYRERSKIFPYGEPKFFRDCPLTVDEASSTIVGSIRRSDRQQPPLPKGSNRRTRLCLDHAHQSSWRSSMLSKRARAISEIAFSPSKTSGLRWSPRFPPSGQAGISCGVPCRKHVFVARSAV